MVRGPILIGSEIYRRPSYGPRHPLSVQRVPAALDLIRAMGWLDEGRYVDSPQATPAELARFHDAAYIAALREAERTGRAAAEACRRYNFGCNGNPIFPDMFRRPATACGGTLEAVRLLIENGYMVGDLSTLARAVTRPVPKLVPRPAPVVEAPKPVPAPEPVAAAIEAEPTDWLWQSVKDDDVANWAGEEPGKNGVPFAVSISMTSRFGSANGAGFSRIAFTTEKTAVLAESPSASTSTATAVTPGLRASERSAERVSCSRPAEPITFPVSPIPDSPRQPAYVESSRRRTRSR